MINILEIMFSLILLGLGFIIVSFIIVFFFNMFTFPLWILVWEDEDEFSPFYDEHHADERLGDKLVRIISLLSAVIGWGLYLIGFWF